MRTALVAREGGWDEAKALIERFGLEAASKQPEVVITYGGDGTLLTAEEQYPGIPKLLLKASDICKKCSALSNEEVLELFTKGAYVIEELFNLVATGNGMTLSALSEISIRNEDPRRAIRFRFRIGEREWSHDLIGDGLLVSTPFGSTGYYRSITRSFFETGLGVAFNNVTEPVDHIVVSEDTVITLTLTRGPGVVIADTQQNSLPLDTNDEVVIRRSPEHMTRLVIVDFGDAANG